MVSEVNAEKLEALAKEYEFVTGKWIMFVPIDEIDALWRKIGLELLEGRLKSVIYVKVDAVGDDETSPYTEKEKKISFGTRNFTDKANMLMVRK
jgi:hypothetical protein